MIYKLYVTEDGAPKAGLTPAWSSLHAIDGQDRLAGAPAVFEIGGGWYGFAVRYGTAPFDVPELVGVIDAGAALSPFERYLPVTISLRDLALAKIVNNASYRLADGVETIRDDVDAGDELVVTLSQEEDVEYRVVSGG